MRRAGARALAAVLTASLGLGLGACRRQEPPRVDLLDEDGTPPETEAIANLAPPWPAAERAVLGDGLLVHWLTEEGAPVAHLRLILPTHGLEGEVSAAAAAVVAEAIALELRRWSQRYSATVELRAGVDRLEIAVHGADDSLDALIVALGRVVTQDDPQALLGRARDTVASGVTTLSGDTLALTGLIGALDGRDPGRERFDRAAVMEVETAALSASWKALLDPTRALLVVHAGRPVAEAALGRLAKAWPRPGGLLGGLAKTTEQALERLRPSARERGKAASKEAASAGERLRGERAATLRLLTIGSDDRGGSLIYLGRILPLPDAKARATARLAQRLLQEEIDARLTIVGERGLFVVRLPLTRVAPKRDGDAPPAKDAAKERGKDRDKDKGPRDLRARRLQESLDATLGLVRGRLPRVRLAQAAELWLGARMVQASLTGEDWTALWSESIDLSVRDAEIAGALAHDAQAMLSITPEELSEWTAKWLDFDNGEPGWAWVAASSEPDMAAALGEIARVESVAP